MAMSRIWQAIVRTGKANNTHLMQPLLSLISNRLVNDFPDPNDALEEPDGLIAAGGELSVDYLVRAYRRGIFPWFSAGQPILWWSPAERSVIIPGAVKISRSLKKTLKREPFDVCFDQNFEAVIAACAAPRAKQPGTWITAEMKQAYLALHQLGYAHSLECYRDDQLVGGLYGVALGRVFFGESMFSHVSDASKVALVALSNFLRNWDYELIDCQIHNPHLASMGAQLMARSEFLDQLAQTVEKSPATSAWQAQAAECE